MLSFTNINFPVLVSICLCVSFSIYFQFILIFEFQCNILFLRVKFFLYLSLLLSSTHVSFPVLVSICLCVSVRVILYSSMSVNPNICPYCCSCLCPGIYLSLRECLCPCPIVSTNISFPVLFSICLCGSVRVISYVHFSSY